MQLSNKREGRVLMSNSRGVKGKGALRTFSYSAFETEFLTFIRGLKLQETEKPDNHDIALLEGEVLAHEEQIGKLQARLKTKYNEALLPVLDDYNDKRKAKQVELDAARSRVVAPTPKQSQAAVVNVLTQLSKLQGQELVEARERLKAGVAILCSVIKVWIWADGFWKYCVAEVAFRDAGTQAFGLIERNARVITALGAIPLTRGNMAEYMNPTYIANWMSARIGKTERPLAPFETGKAKMVEIPQGIRKISAMLPPLAYMPRESLRGN